MIPDKIYLNSKHPEPYWFKDKQVDSDIEYIRKDALLEWAKDDGLEERADKGDAWAIGYRCAMRDLIDKLELIMTKAEQRALDALPPRYRKSKDGTTKIDSVLPVRKLYIRAYEQAEKDIKDALLEYLQKNVDYYAEGGETGHIMSLTYKDVLRKVQSL